ncbi:MAG: hypothetical protein Q8939_15565 [Bacteroidota bacterium]|nr:hypothetical protein [Bacteroidota bacterium]
MDTSKVWYVTEVSHGLGLTLVKKLLETGHRVAAPSRNIRALKKAIVRSMQLISARWRLSFSEMI